MIRCFCKDSKAATRYTDTKRGSIEMVCGNKCFIGAFCASQSYNFFSVRDHKVRESFVFTPRSYVAHYLLVKDLILNFTSLVE